MKLKQIFFCSFILILVLLNSAPTLSYPHPPLSLNFSFNQAYYRPSDSFVGKIRLVNKSNQALTNIKTRLIISSKMKIRQGKILPPKAIWFLKTWHSWQLKPGSTEIELKGKLANLYLDEGVYPVLVTVSQAEKEIAKEETSLVVLKPRRDRLSVAILWDFHQPAHFNPQNIYTDAELSKSFIPTYRRHLKMLDKYPTQINANITPLLIQQIVDISHGYKLKTNNQTEHLSPTSAQAQEARNLLKDLKTQIDKKRLEVVPAPYGYPSLPLLAQEGWGKDVSAQIKEGQNVMSEQLGLKAKPEGLYSPDFKLIRNLPSLLAKEEVKYTVLDDRFLWKELKQKGSIHEPYQTKASQENTLTLFFRDGLASKALMEPKSSVAISKLVGILAYVYLNEPSSGKVVVIAPEEPNWQPSSSTLKLFYQTLPQIPWIQMGSLSVTSRGASVSKKVLVLPQKTTTLTYSQARYYQKLSSSREKIKMFSPMLQKNNPLGRRLRQSLFIAEAVDWLRTKEGQQKGLSFVSHISSLIEKELAKIKTARREVVNLTGRSGQIPLAITNGTNYPLRVKIILRSQDGGLSFPAGSKREVVLEPKDNLFTFKVKTKRPGSSTVQANIKSNGQTIKRSLITVKTPYLGKNLTIILIAVLVVGALAGLILVLWKRKSSRED